MLEVSKGLCPGPSSRAHSHPIPTSETEQNPSRIAQHVVTVPLSSLCPGCHGLRLDLCRNCWFLQRLLADGGGLEDVWPETGETPLLMAINYADVEVRT